MSLESLRSAIATALVTIPKVRATAYLTDQISPPSGGAHVMFDMEIDYDITLGGNKDTYAVTLQAFTQRDSERAGQRFLDQLRDPSSATCVQTVLESYDWNSVSADYMAVKKAGRVQVIDAGGTTPYLMVEFEAELIA